MRAVYLLAALLLFSGDSSAQEKKEKPQQVVFRLTNEFRASQKLPPLKWNDTLARTAQKHVEALVAFGKHGDSGKNPHILNGKNYIDRAFEEGYRSTDVNENIHWVLGNPDPARNAVDAWKKSP